MRCKRCYKLMENHRDPDKARRGYRTCPFCFLTHSPEAVIKDSYAVLVNGQIKMGIGEIPCLLKYEYTDNGYCRVYYSWRNSENQKIMYCAQDEGRQGVTFYRCSAGDWSEPDYPVRLKSAPPVSPGDTETDKIVNQWIKEKWNNQEVKDAEIKST